MVDRTIIVPTAVRGSFSAEAGFGGSGNTSDGSTFTITGSGFGTKSQAAAKVFDTFDTYYDNGTAETPYSALNDGDTIPSTSSDPFDTHVGVWTKDVAGTYGRRSAAYKSQVAADGNSDYWMDAWKGWATVDGNNLYCRWYFWVDEEGFQEAALDGNHSSSATNITITPSNLRFSDASAAPRLIITLNDASLHRTTLALPKISGTNCDITDALPSAADSGNAVFIDNKDSTKFIRVWDVTSGSSDLLQLSWTWNQITNQGPAANNESDTEPNSTAGGAGSWNLMEIEVFHAQEEADETTSFYKAWLNGTQIGSTITGDISKAAGTWPFSGIVPRLIGQDHSTGTKWKMPNNFFRLAEIYADKTTQRIEIGDHATVLRSSTVREVCQIKSWSDTQIEFIVNQGEHTSVKGNYVYHVDDNNSETLIGQYI